MDSRMVDDGERIRRRRLCEQCTKRFSTLESASLSMPRVIKRDGNSEAFDDAKLRAGLQKALEKRPVTAKQIDQAINGLLQKLAGESEIGYDALGEEVMELLRHLDKVGYVRFASVYRDFADVQAFSDEVERLQDR